MTNNKPKKKNKTKILQIRVDLDFYNDFEKWLKLHSPHNLSKFTRMTWEEKMYEDTPLVSEFDKIEQIINKNHEQLVKLIGISTESTPINRFGDKSNDGRFRKRDENDLKSILG